MTNFNSSLEEIEKSKEEYQEDGYFYVDVDSDFHFFRQHLSDPSFEVQPYFDKRKWSDGDTFHLRVGHVYDLSHFWIVTKFKELEVLQSYLSEFYKSYKEDYKIGYSLFKLNMYCVCYTEGAFYRGCFTGIESQYTMENYAFVFLIDFGCIAKVSISELYFMPKNLYDVPRMAIRASMAGVCPLDLKAWSSQAVNEFTKEVYNVILTGKVAHVATSQKVLFLRLSKTEEQTGENKLVEDNLLRQGVINSFVRKTVRKTHQKLLFLEPSFNKLEKGLVLDVHGVAKAITEKIG